MSTELREQIDSIDAQVARLLARRREVSHRLQQERVRSGGARVDLARETEVIRGYVVHLGADGRDVASTVLSLCRGDANAADYECQG